VSNTSSCDTDPTGACKLHLGRVGENEGGITLLRSPESMAMRVGHICCEGLGFLANRWHEENGKRFLVVGVLEGEMYFSSFESMSERRAWRLNEDNIVKRACSLRKMGLVLSI
jgi:hypothetical protein